MFNTIVVGVDGGEGGRDALSLAGRLAGSSGADLLAVQDLPADYYAMRSGSPPFAASAEDDARAEIHDELRQAGLDARVRVVGDTSPARALHRIAEEEHADLIVVGSTRHGRAGRVLIGDHAAGTVHASPCPVAVAPRGYAGRGWRDLLRVGVGFDGRPEARQALEFAVGLARDAGATLEVVAAVGSPVLEADAGRYDHEWMGAATAEARADLDEALRDLDVEHDSRVVAGLTDEELTKLSAGVDVLVLGSRGWGPVRRVLLGSVAAKVMRAAHCPILVLPRGAATGQPGERDPGASAGVA